MSLFRNLVRFLGPSWLVKDYLDDGTETDSRTLWSISLVLDAQLERLRRGILARYPGPAGAKPGTPGAPDDALPLLCRDRLIVRGPSEPVSHVTARLQRAIDDHRVRGNAWALLEQIQGVLSPRAVKVALVNEHGNWYTLAADGTKTRSKPRFTDGGGTIHPTWNWDGSALVDAWARAWVIIYCEDGALFQPGPTIGDPALWGGTVENPAATISSTATQDEAIAVLQILPDWIMAGSRLLYVVLSFNDSDFDPSAAQPPLPDGTWANYSKNVGGTQVPARNTDGRYWKGTGP